MFRSFKSLQDKNVLFDVRRSRVESHNLTEFDTFIKTINSEGIMKYFVFPILTLHCFTQTPKIAHIMNAHVNLHKLWAMDDFRSLKNILLDALEKNAVARVHTKATPKLKR